MQLKDLAESRASLLNFDPRKLKVKPGLNARDMTSPENIEHVEWLAENIAEHGVKTPLVIFKDNNDDVFVANGHCRLAATMLAIERGADILTVPCIPETPGTNDVDRILNQAGVDNSGKRLSALEEGANIKRALAMGVTAVAIAKRISKSVSYVEQAVKFQAAPAEVHEMVKAGEVTHTLAAKVVRSEGAEEGTKVLKKAVETAKADGKKKATARHLPEPTRAPAKKVQVANSLMSGLQKLADEIEFASQDLDNCNASTLEGWARRIRSFI